MDRVHRRGLVLAATILAVGCGQTPDMVTVRLIDPQDSRAWPGKTLSLVEVHRAPIAPFSGLERLWRRSHGERIDTVPGVRAVGTVTVVDERRVMGFHGEADGRATVFQYDAFSQTLRQLPLPNWFQSAAFNPFPEFAPGGRHVLFLARRPDDMMRAEVHSWPDGALAVAGRAVRPNPRGATPPRLTWGGNGTEFIASLPVVSDTGPIVLLFKGRVSGTQAWMDSGTRYVDMTLPTTPTLRPRALPTLPRAFRAELERRGCTVPPSHRSENVISGHFAASRQVDWAVLCSVRGQSTIVVSWGGAVQCPRDLRPAWDHNYQMRLGDRIWFTRSIHTTDRYQVHDAAGRPAIPEAYVDLEHDAIEDLNEGWGSTVWLCRGGKWIEFPGSGSRKTGLSAPQNP